MSQYLRLTVRIERYGIGRLSDFELRCLAAEVDDRRQYFGDRAELVELADRIAAERASRRKPCGCVGSCTVEDCAAARPVSGQM